MNEPSKIAREAVCGGAQNALRALLDNWTDSNDVNRVIAETLLALSIVQAEGLE